jgi:hypothetical protein
VALNIEAIVDDLSAYLQAHLPTALTTVMNAANSVGRPSYGIAVPGAASYFIGEQSRYRAYQAPALFLIVPSTVRPNEGRAGEWATMLHQEHTVLLDILMEAPGEEALTRCCYRMADAIDATVHDQDITPPTITTRATKVFVTKVDYGAMFTPKDSPQRVFRKDVWVQLLVRHDDQLTPIP